MFNQPTRMIEYSCDWLFSNDSTMIVQSTGSRDLLFDNNCSTEFSQPARVIDYSLNDRVTLIIRQLAWLTIRQWLSHIAYSSLIDQLIKLIIHSSSQSSSIKQLAWLIIRVIDYSVMIRQWLFNQPARVIDYSTIIVQPS